MNYPPKIHQDNDINHIIEVIKTYPLATVISIKDNIPFITHLPLVYNEFGKLIGHIDKQNPHAALLKNEYPVTILFSGPQCYISPSIYTTTQLPTWNYIKVHLKGTVNAIESKEALKESIIKMTEFLEAPKHKYILDPNNQRMLGALDYIEMFEITINSWEGKFKLSQDKKPQDIKNARAELIRSNHENIERFLNNIF
ncbi:FMN-binding negative transcriptional regulator [Mariniflexile litorale]|uniref:FMN-binding negative transcriptional regulator n=1 Tax=Mariniflexile litorale TaxID=3045158 RepID=A0AAU7ECE3_9FLAO|nr:FMN-binding negative transcriptional regulator [Mariniflexile sp. KMM 9835]MDQ8212514.1 FMN-binding negative transcriptional regulator [Mariniflexile sp. KMM 9835]